MKLLIAVKSCRVHQESGYHDAILNTWGKDLPLGVDLRFFVGNSDSPKPKTEKTICLGVPDDYMSLPLKTKAIVGWSLWNEYDHCFCCDTDTFTIPTRLLKCGFEKFDYSGRFGAMPKIGTTFRYKDAHQTVEECHCWASGGVGYFLSNKAARIVSESEPNHWAEDCYVGQTLGPHIQSGNIIASDLLIECVSSWHFPRRSYNNQPYDPKFGWLEKMQKEYGYKNV